MAEEEALMESSSSSSSSIDGDHHDLRSLLSSKDRDFLIRNNGDHVKISDLEGKIVGLYFSASWCGPCRRFTPILAEAFNELASRDSNFEIVFISGDEDDEDFDDYFAKMPWLAIPFSDEDTRGSLSTEFDVQGYPTVVIIDKDGKLLTDEAVQGVRDYGAEGFPFTEEKIERLKEEEEEARLNQTITSVLVTNTRDFVLTSNVEKVPVSDLEGKIVGLYFSLSSFEACAGFTRRLVKFYNELKERGENFEIVLVSLEEDESSFMDDFEDMPWLGIPFKDKLSEKLVRYFELEDLPTLTVIGTDGKTVNINVVELIEDYGVEAYPFTSKKLREIKRKERERIENQTLESLLVSGEKDFVIKNDGSQVPVSELVGKNILLFFSSHWCPPGRAFLPHLIEVYNNIKEKDSAFEIIFISSDEDEESFEGYFSQMPWPSLPFWDERKRFLSRVFKISGIPACVAINPEGKTVMKEARSLIMEHGANAYPFTKEQIKKLKDELEEKAKNWPEKVKHKGHNHVLLKTRRDYMCDGCGKGGRDWSFHCQKCDYDLHPHCALDDDREAWDSDDDDEDDEAAWPEKIKHMLHKHVLLKAWRSYQCDACGVVKHGYWSYFCEECDFDLHPECALGNQATVKVVDSDDESDVNDEDEDDESDEDDGIDGNANMNANVQEEEEEVSLHSNFKRALKVGETDSDDEEDENPENEIEGRHDAKEEDEEVDEDEDEKDEDEEVDEDEDEKDEDEEVDEDEDEKDEDEEVDEDEDEKDEDEEVDEDEDEKDEDGKSDQEEDEDGEGPGMRGYACNTRDREGLESFQESLFTCKLYK